MPTKPLMNWIRSEKRWRKQYLGSIYKVSPKELGTPQTKEDSMIAANHWWIKRKAEIDQKTALEWSTRKNCGEYTETLKEIDALLLLSQARYAHESEFIKSLLRRRERLAEALKQPSLPPIKPELKNPLRVTDADSFYSCVDTLSREDEREMGLPKGTVFHLPDIEEFDEYCVQNPDFVSMPDTRIAVWEDRIERQKIPVNEGNSTNHYIELYVESRRNEYLSGSLSSGRWKRLKSDLEYWSDWEGFPVLVDDISTENLTRFKNNLMGKIKIQYQFEEENPGVEKGKPGISSFYGRDILSTVKLFIYWLQEAYSIKTIGDSIRHSKNFTIKIKHKEPTVISLSDLKTILNSIDNEKNLLYIYLALNCGYTQADIGKLRQTDVDWKSGRIERKRSKTRKHKNVPKVNYLLWPEIFELLCKYRSNDRDLALLNEDGKPLWLDLDSKTRIDSIKSVWWRIMQGLKMSYTFTDLRKSTVESTL